MSLTNIASMSTFRTPLGVGYIMVQLVSTTYPIDMFRTLAQRCLYSLVHTNTVNFRVRNVYTTTLIFKAFRPRQIFCVMSSPPESVT